MLTFFGVHSTHSPFYASKFYFILICGFPFSVLFATSIPVALSESLDPPILDTRDDVPITRIASLKFTGERTYRTTEEDRRDVQGYTLMFLHAVLPALDQNALSISVEHSSWDTGPKQSNPTRTNPEKFTMTLKPLSRGLANLVKKATVYTAYFWLEDSVVNGYLTIPSGKGRFSSEARKKIIGDETTTFAEVRKGKLYHKTLPS
ncbi:hypothetical protein DFH05DRAFT_1261735 [Lentinula detonsa]|uniref:Uncharacterized protein n=1 Tax=Lentinula detonsa TaxID=2804962 RepID=A0A9W8NXR1_9AGAR|nr:hypothetical protein DFH05DRAFT_1261735 [Lentinula detonsa]